MLWSISALCIPSIYVMKSCIHLIEETLFWNKKSINRKPYNMIKFWQQDKVIRLVNISFISISDLPLPISSEDDFLHTNL